MFPTDEKDLAVAQQNTYNPLPSVWHGDDAELLERMISFYPHKMPTDILDATINTGRFWRGSVRKVTGMDINPEVNPDIIADNCDMPCKDA